MADELAEESAAFDPALKGIPIWVETAWRLYCRGQRNWTQLRNALEKQFGSEAPKDPETVKARVKQFAAVLGAARKASEDDHALISYQVGLEEILATAWQDHATEGIDSAKIGALRVALDALEKLAASQGVITERKAQETSWKDSHERTLSREQLARLALGDVGTSQVGGEDNGPG